MALSLNVYPNSLKILLRPSQPPPQTITVFDPSLGVATLVDIYNATPQPSLIQLEQNGQDRGFQVLSKDDYGVPQVWKNSILIFSLFVQCLVFFQISIPEEPHPLKASPKKMVSILNTFRDPPPVSKPHDFLESEVLHHPTTRRRFPCRKCKSTFSLEKNLKIHVLVEHPRNDILTFSPGKKDNSGGKIDCPFCDKTFSRLAGFRSHVLFHYSIEEEVRFAAHSKIDRQ